jgi:alkylhydroperoxidase family enzyme
MLSTPRIPPLAPEEMDDQARELVGEVGGDTRGAVNIFRTLVRHPGLFRRWLPFGGKLLVGKLPARDRELMILRTGWNCHADYEWAQHVVIARRTGITDDEIARIKEGSDAPGWDAWDATLLRAADELHRDSILSDATWTAMAEVYDERQLIEVPMLVGHYHMVAYALNSLGVQVEPAVAAETA